MIAPGSFALALAMMLATMVFWGSWANTARLARDWPLPLYYFDYALGILAAAWIPAALSGRAVCDGLREADGAARIAAVAAGALLCVGNFLLMLGIARVGMTVAFPVSVGFALVVSTAASWFIHPLGDPVLLASGVAAVFCAVLLNSAVYRTVAPRQEGVPRGGILMCFTAGVLFSICGSLVAKAVAPPHPVAPLAGGGLYALGSLLAAGPMLAIVTSRLPGGVAGYARQYAAGSVRAHLAGLAGGLIWGSGLVLTLLAASRVGMAIAGAVGQANPLVAAMWGIFVWKEFRGAPARTWGLLAVMLGLYGLGVALLGLSVPKI